MKPSILSILLISACLFCSSCAQVSQKRLEQRGQLPLDIKQLQVEFKGKDLHIQSIDLDATVHFQENMKLQATDYFGNSEKGKWTLMDENLLCLEFESWYYGDQNCYRVIQDKGAYLFFTRNGAPSYRGTISDKVIARSSPDTSIDKKLSEGEASSPQLINTLKPSKENTESAKQRFTRLAKNCPDCNFRGVDLSNTQLSHANLAGADLSGANLTNTNLRQANLQRANLAGAQLVRTNFAGADLSWADLSNADLSGSNLIRANVTHAIFKDTNLTGAHLESIQGKIQ